MVQSLISPSTKNLDESARAVSHISHWLSLIYLVFSNPNDTTCKSIEHFWKSVPHTLKQVNSSCRFDWRQSGIPEWAANFPRSNVKILWSINVIVVESFSNTGVFLQCLPQFHPWCFGFRRRPFQNWEICFLMKTMDLIWFRWSASASF